MISEYTRRAHKTLCLGREEEKGSSSLAELRFLAVAPGCFQQLCPRTLSLTLFHTTVETGKDHCVGHLNVYRSGCQQIVRYVGHR